MANLNRKSDGSRTPFIPTDQRLEYALLDTESHIDVRQSRLFAQLDNQARNQKNNAQKGTQSRESNCLPTQGLGHSPRWCNAAAHHHEAGSPSDQRPEAREGEEKGQTSQDANEPTAFGMSLRAPTLALALVA